MAYFPFFIDVKDKKCLVIGGGKVAYRKITTLLEFEVEIHLITKKVCPELYKLKNKINIIKKPITIEDLQNDYFFVICATNDKQVNNTIYKACKEKNILINAADNMKKCNFLFPAIVKKNNIITGITTSGKSPIMASNMRNNIENIIPDFYGNLTDQLGEVRNQIRNKIKNPISRKKILQKISEKGIKLKRTLSEDEINKIIEENENNE
ncbi:MAG: bifunctional precorrin-2 dehydrogenase/sirohydrochlorin ferrochelatase [Lachnospirales bacterium]